MSQDSGSPSGDASVPPKDDLAAGSEAGQDLLERVLVALTAVHRPQAGVEVDLDVRHGLPPRDGVRRAA